MISKIIGIIILVICILFLLWINIHEDYFSHCYTAEEYSGNAIFGNCSGKKGESECKRCRYYVDLEAIKNDMDVN